MIPEPALKAKKDSSLNTTAYRIFKILSWLIQEPLSAEEINARFIEDPQTGKSVSTDSIWLYINTLKALGCQIQRPCKSNQFQYQLTRHPFCLMLTHQDVATLGQIRTLAEEYFSPDEVLQLDQFFQQLLQNTWLPSESTLDLVQLLHQQSRSIDYQPQSGPLAEIKTAIKEEHILSVLYRSPLKGKESILLLPTELKYTNGALYLIGYQPEFEDTTLLRVDRILETSPVQPSHLTKKLLHRFSRLDSEHPVVEVHFYVSSPDTIDPFQMGETWQYIEDGEPPYLQLTLLSRDFFTLRQKILASGVPFSIISPAQFKTEMVSTLKQMLCFYSESAR